MFKKITLSMVIATLFAGCALDTNEAQGSVIGGIAGGVIGSQFGKGDGQVAMAAAGALIGSMVGGSVGKSMDEKDKKMMNQASQEATTAPVGTSIVWNNPSNGHKGEVTVVKEGQDASGRPCRQISQKVVIDGQMQEALSTVCKADNGNWYVVAQ